MILPHGGQLISRFFSVLEKSNVTLTIDQSKEIDIYNIAAGAYSPLKGFAYKEEFESITKKLHLPDGTLWSIPIIFDIT